jgi:hypothetical protein
MMAAGGLLAAAGPLAGGARAVIHPAGVLAGPSTTIVAASGAAMAPDGSGGILYRQEVEGATHLFAVPFRNGSWGTPTQVDTEDHYGAGEATLAAGDGGRLLVVWVQPRNVSADNVREYELMSATLAPGASGFGRAVAVDTNVGEPETGDVNGVAPRLAMAPDGEAYVVYRVTLDDCARGDEGNPERPKCRAGSTDKVVSVRLARFDYLTWSSLGQINRASQIAMRGPSAENAPSIGIALNGNGVVAWQEPESGNVARIWARRLFGTVKGNVLQVSPSTIGGRPVTSDAYAPAVAVGPYGETRIAFLVKGAQGSAVTSTQLYVNSMQSEIAPHGFALQGASAIAGASGSSLAVPSIAVAAESGSCLSWSLAGAVYEQKAGAAGNSAPIAVGQSEGATLSTINPAGGGTTAWSLPPGSAPAVQVREDYAAGAFQTALLAGGVSGSVSGLSLGGDGAGDALIEFMQGPPGDAEILGGWVQAPPAPFVLSTPVGWIRQGQATIGWEGAVDAEEGVSYAVLVDGRVRLSGLKGLSASLSAASLGDGRHHVQVLATDRAGQQTMSPRSELNVDASPPVVRLRLVDHGRGVRVSVRDDTSGVDTSATRIAFGDGRRSSGRSTVTHVYRRAGLYTIVALVRDNAGNRARVHLRVRAL